MSKIKSMTSKKLSSIFHFNGQNISLLGGVASQYAPASTTMKPIPSEVESATFVRIAQALYNAKQGQDGAAVAVLADGSVLVERDGDSKRQVCFFDGETFYTGIRDGKQFVPYNEDEHAGTILLMALSARELVNDKEFGETFDKLVSCWDGAGSADATIVEARAHMVLMTSNLYYRLKDGRLEWCSVEQIEEKMFMKDFDTAKLAYGVWKVFQNKSGKAVKARTGKFEPYPVVTAMGSKAITTDPFPADVQHFLSKPGAHIMVTEQADSTASIVYNTMGAVHPIRNFIYSGPAGSGKTTSAEVTSCLLGLPYYAEQVDPSFDASMWTSRLVLGSGIAPELKRATTPDDVRKFFGVPTASDIKAFPSMYFEMYYKDVEYPGDDIATERCITASGEDLASKMLHYMQQNSGNMYKQVDSYLAKAVEFGGVVLLDEANLAKPEVLTALNTLLEQGILEMPDGRILHRHPACIIILGCNYGYAGTRGFNKAFKSRFVEFSFGNPVVEEMARTVEAATGYDFDKLCEMARVINEIYAVAEAEGDYGIDPGMRDLMQWATLVSTNAMTMPNAFCIAVVNKLQLRDAEDFERVLAPWRTSSLYGKSTIEPRA